MGPNEHPEKIEPGKIVVTEDGHDDDGYPKISTNVGAPAATITAVPGENG